MATTISGHTVPRAPARPRNLVADGATTAHTTARWVTGPAFQWARHAATRARSFTLQAGGLAAITYGAYDWRPTVGYLTGGAALIVLEYLTGGGDR